MGLGRARPMGRESGLLLELRLVLLALFVSAVGSVDRCGLSSSGPNPSVAGLMLVSLMG